MNFNTAVALAGFAFVMSASPGPANFLLLASGANFGFRKSLPLVLGISLGFLTMVFFVGLGVNLKTRDYPGTAAMGQDGAHAPIIKLFILKRAIFINLLITNKLAILDNLFEF